MVEICSTFNTTILPAAKALYVIGRFFGKQLHHQLKILYCGVHKTIQQLPEQATKHLQYWKGKIDQRLPERRKRMMRALWRYSKEDIRAYQSQADAEIDKMLALRPDSVQKFTIKGEGNSILDGVSLIHPDYATHIIYFGGVSYLWQRSFSVLQQFHNYLQANVHSFNYKGTTDVNNEDPTEEGIISDGVKIVEELLRKGIAVDKIILYGRSLGGGVAICLAAKLAERGIDVHAMDERSFRNFRLATASLFPKGSHLADHFKWQFRKDEALIKLKGKLIVIYHEGDRVIPTLISYKKYIDVNPPSHLQVRFIKMQDDGTRWPYANEPFANYIEAHCRDFNAPEWQEIAKVYKETMLS